MKRSPLILFALILLGAFPAGAKAETLYFGFKWKLGEVEVPADPFWVEEQQPFVETRLWPVELYRADADVVGVDGRLLLPEGGQLIAADTDQRVICNFDYGADRDYRSGRMRVCLVDDDGDQDFDSYYQLNLNSYGYIMMGGRIMTRRSPLAPVALSRIDSREMVDAPFMSLNYERILDADNDYVRMIERNAGSVLPNETAVRFFRTIGRESKRNRSGIPCLGSNGEAHCASGTLPSEITFWGMTLHILERRQEDILVQIVSSFDPVEIDY